MTGGGRCLTEPYMLGVLGSTPSRPTKESDVDIRRVALDLLRDCYADEIAHLELRMIRDDQAPRFQALQATHSEFMRTSCVPGRVHMKSFTAIAKPA